MAPSQRRLSKADIDAIASIVTKNVEEKESSSTVVGMAHPFASKDSWLSDKHKRHRVFLVGAMLLAALILEKKFELSWFHRVAEVCTDCVADFLLFGSLE